MYRFFILALAAMPLFMPSASIAQQNMLKQQLPGTWTLISSTIEKDGKTTEPFGPKPLGYMTFDSSGHFTYNFMRADRPKFASNNRDTGTADEYKAAIQGNLSSFGTYTINADGTVTFHIIGSSFPNWNGTDQKRLIEINGDQLKYAVPAASIGGTAVAAFSRAK